MIVWQRRDGTTIRLDGDRFRDMRESHGFSQRTLAERIGCTAAAVSTWETESRCPSLPQIARILDVFGRDLARTGALTVEIP